MNKKGGLLSTVIIMVVVFLIGTFFGWGILANFFGEDTVERLSPELELTETELFERCAASDLIVSQLCSSVVVEEVTADTQTNSGEQNDVFNGNIIIEQLSENETGN